MARILCALAFLALLAAPVSAQQDRAPVLRVLTSDFVLPGKFRALAPLAEAEGVVLESITVGPDAGDLLAGADLVLLDVPRPNDRALVESALEGQGGVPRLTVGGGRPDWQGLEPQDAARLAGWYAAGGPDNFRQFFRYVAAWSRDAPREGFPDPVPLPEIGIYHPDAPRIFGNVSDYLDWSGREGGIIGVAISPGTVSGLQSGTEDALIRAIEAEGLTPLAFWSPQDALAGLARDADLAALVIRTHMRGGPGLAEAMLEMDIPVIQTLGYREGTPADFRQAQSGVGQGAAAIFLAGAEVWGASDPLVLMAVENGEEVVIPEQLDALTAKLRSIAALQGKPDAEKRLALLFWNYPAGERNLSASNLNAPRSIAAITEGLAGAGYGVDPITEAQAIRGAQALLSAIWRSTPPEELLAEGLAATLPVGDYRDWLDTLPPGRQRELRASGDPARHWAVREVHGIPSFVIPRLQLGNLVVLPQMPRDAHGHGHYHDTAAAPDHLYLAAYLWLREGFGTDAIIHLGTHGTQEWLKGKDRGLWAADYPMLAVGDVPVFYPYLQDNVAEAIQAKRRGRAVIVSHQTPPFAPAGLQEDLRDIHHLIHDHAQLAPGPVRDEAARRIRQAVAESGLDADMGWDAARIEADFDHYLAELDEPGNAVAANSRRIAAGLIEQGIAPDQATQLSRYRIFSNAPDSYGSGVSHVTLDSASWDDESTPAQTFLNGTRFAYGAAGWGEAPAGVNLFAEQLRGSDAAIMSRSSNLHGVLGSDHPFELLGGLALAVRHLDGASPELFISDLRRGAPRTATLAAFLADELRLRYLSPQWIEAMQAEGYAGTLAVLEGVDNLFGWQVTAPESLRADQWQAMFDTYVADSRDLGIEGWFETHNPSAQAQLIARMAEAIRKDYWDAPEETRRLMAERWQELAAMPEVRAGEAGATREFLAAMAAGYGLDAAPAPAEAEAAASAEPEASVSEPDIPEPENLPEAQPEQVQGRVLEQVQHPLADSRLPWGLALIGALVGLGAAIQIATNRREPTTEKMHDLA